MFEDNTVRNNRFTARLLIESDWPMFSCISQCSKQLPLLQIGQILGHHINAKISPKAASEKTQTTVSENRYTSPNINVFRTAILTLIAPMGDNARASFLVHQAPRTSSTVWGYHRIFMQFSLRV